MTADRGGGVAGRARSVLGGAALAALLALAGCGPRFPDPSRLRAVVVVDVDTLRADALSVYGYPRPTSPAIDAFARRAVRFDWAVSQAPYTLPSQTSILTGLYPSTHRVLHDGDRLAPETVTLAERFREAGFTTAAFIDGGYLKSAFGLDQGFDTYFDINGGGLAVGESHIARYLEEHAKKEGERLFLLIHTYDVHTPYAPPEPFRSRFLAGLAAPTPGFEPTSAALEEIRLSHYTPAPKRLESRDLDYARALYDGEVAFVDAWFGRFEAQLEKLGLAESTVLALTSDHGEEFQEHGSLLHEKLHLTVSRIPLIVRAPHAVAGAVVDEPVQAIDLAPTLLELAGIEPHPGLEGRSLVPRLAGRPGGEARPAISESPFFGVQRAILGRDAHLLLSFQSGAMELYRYRADPLEKLDLAPANTDEIRPLLAELRAWGGGRPPEALLEREGVELPDEVARSLRALGYLR